MPGLVISIGGKLDQSFNAALNQAARAAVDQNARIRKSIAASNVSAEEKAAAYARLALDDEINRKIVNNDSARRAIRLSRTKAENAAMSGSGGYGWVVAGGMAGGSFAKGFFSRLAMNPGAIQQLMAVVSNSMSALAAGQSVTRVVAMELPNVGQALFSGVRGFVARIVPAIMSGIGIGLAAAGATWIARESTKMRQASDESAASNKMLRGQGENLKGRISDKIDEMVAAKKLDQERGEILKTRLGYHESILRVQKELLAIEERSSAKSAADAANVAESVQRSTAAREALATIEESNWTRSQIRNDLAAREKGLVNLKARMAATDKSSPEGQRMQAKLDEENLAIAQDRQRLKSGSAPARSVSERERIGLGASSSVQVSILDVQRKIHGATLQTNTRLDSVINALEAGL